MTFGLADLAAALGDRPLVAIAGAYAGGVLTSLTPCLYPMIPVTAAIVGGPSRETTRWARAAGSPARSRWAWRIRVRPR